LIRGIKWKFLLRNTMMFNQSFFGITLLAFKTINEALPFEIRFL